MRKVLVEYKDGKQRSNLLVVKTYARGVAAGEQVVRRLPGRRVLTHCCIAMYLCTCTLLYWYECTYMRTAILLHTYVHTHCFFLRTYIRTYTLLY